MVTSLEKHLDLKLLIEKESKARFPDSDPKLFVRTWMDHKYDDSRQTAKVIVSMMPEIVRQTIRGK